MAIKMCDLYYYDSKYRSCVKASWLSLEFPSEEAYKKILWWWLLWQEQITNINSLSTS